MPNLHHSPPPQRRTKQKQLSTERVTASVTPVTTTVTPSTPSSANDAREPREPDFNANAALAVPVGENQNANGESEIGGIVRDEVGKDGQDGLKSRAGDSCGDKKSASAAPGTTEGMDANAGVRKLADHVFDIWGGRSRTPSVDGGESEPDQDQDKDKCRGGPGKSHCGEPVKEGENGIRCDKCHFWYHGACQAIPKTAVTAAGKFPMLHWFCSACHFSIFNTGADAISEWQKTKDALDSLESGVLNKVDEKIELLTKSISDHCKLVNRTLRQLEEHAVDQTKMLERTVRQQHEEKASYAEIVKSSCSALTDSVAEKLNGISGTAQLSENQSQSSRDIHKTVSTVLDKERRKLNVVVFNLPESTPEDGVTREEKDLSKFKDIVKENLKLIVKASKCYRVGKLQENRPRLLILTLEDLDSKIELLRLSSQLRHSESWNNLYIKGNSSLLTWGFELE